MGSLILNSHFDAKNRKQKKQPLAAFLETYSVRNGLPRNEYGISLPNHAIRTLVRGLRFSVLDLR